MPIEVRSSIVADLRKRVSGLDGTRVEFGIPAPSASHKPVKGKVTVNTAQVLAFIEFGVGVEENKKAAAKPKRGSRRRTGRLRRMGRALLGRLLGGFKRRRPPARAPSSKPPAKPKGRPARPVIRWVAAARRREMTLLMGRAYVEALRGKDPAPQVEALRYDLAEMTRQRVIAVGAVDTGQMIDDIRAVVKKG